jgi:hypothetical protein
MVSVAELKTQLNIPHTLHDTYLAALEAAAVEVAEQHFGYLGTAEEVTEMRRGLGTDTLILSDAPVIESVDEDYPDVVVTGALAPGGTTSSVTDFVVRGKLLLRTSGVWSRGHEFAVTYMRGYLPGAQPERAHHAVRVLVAHWYMNRTPVSNANASKMPHTLDALLPSNPVIA